MASEYEETPQSEEEVSFIVNGDSYKMKVQSSWTLHYLLHDILGLTGSKEFCNEGACGACAAIVDKRPILSCMTLAVECNGKVIETIEGIARKNHPLIEAYIKYSCMQCGYCTPGFIVTAKALLDKNPDPNEEEIEEALVGNLCRCGTYPRHMLAVQEAVDTLRRGKKDEQR